MRDTTAEALSSSSSSSSSSSPKGIQVRRERRNHLPLSLPSKLLIGYTTTNGISKVVDAVRSGVNVVVWSFVEYRDRDRDNDHDDDHHHGDDDDDDDDSDVCSKNHSSVVCYSTFDLGLARQTIAKLDEEGLDDVIHLVSFGGWNGPHLPPLYSANELYESWKTAFGDVFDGFDWDLEGHDDLNSPTNILTVECLRCMGEMSTLAKNDGYIVGMAPAQSYLDIESSRFSRYLNLTDDTRRGSDDWHSDFHYFGANCYAYLLSKYADAIDFISIQFYESYSKAGLSCYGRGMPKDHYLEKYVEELQEGGMFVDFNQDPSLEYASRNVKFPISKLVFGFANGWGIPGDKVCYFEPSEIETTYKRLADKAMTPRGFMFWVM